MVLHFYSAFPVYWPLRELNTCHIHLFTHWAWGVQWLAHGYFHLQPDEQGNRTSNFPITRQHALPPETQLPVTYQLLNWRNETESSYFNPKMMTIGKTHFWRLKFTWMSPQVKTFWSTTHKNWRVFCHMICRADVTWRWNRLDDT